ncbi:MAG: DUF6312 domain-containing protein [Candidatus Latescibacterota bacterium]|jgi:hypothetical protein
MQPLRLNKKIRRIIVLLPEGRAVTIYKSKGKKRKNSRTLKPVEKALRRLGKANNVYTSTYLKRHKESSRKKRDGWLRDFNYNLHRAARKHAKVVKIPRSLRV